MRILDLFCGGGGCTRGYNLAGFCGEGVDLYGQPNYPRASSRELPFAFRQADALGWLRAILGTVRRDFDAIHASPPCQAHSTAAGQSRKGGKTYSDLIAPTRVLLQATGLPYVIENVVGAPLIDPVRLCGTSFGLPLRRHRLFETNWPLEGLPCKHGDFTEPRYWTGWRPNGEHRLSTVVQVYGNGGDSHEWAEAMGIDWMTKAELTQAIPPAMTEYVGAALMAHLRTRTEAAAPRG